MKVLIIIPAYNEEKSLKRVIDHLEQCCPQYDYVIVNEVPVTVQKKYVRKINIM